MRAWNRRCSTTPSSTVPRRTLLTTELGRWNLEINLPPRTLPGTAACRLEDDVVASIGCARRSAAVVGATPVTIGILPTLGAEHLDSDQLTDDPRYDLLNRQMVDARGEPFRLDIAAPRVRRGRRAPRARRRLDRPRGRLHLAAAAPPAHPGDLPGALERRAGHRRGAGRARRELAVPARPPPLGRDPRAAVRAGRRRAARRAAQPGRPPAGVVRRPLGLLGDRPVRGERPLLPGPAAHGRRRGPPHRPRRRAGSRSSTSCGCTPGRSGGGTARSTTWRTASRTCGWRTGSCPRARPRSTRWPTRCSSTGWCGRSSTPSTRRGAR